jgi:uncharacterized membrane protein
VLIVGSTAAIVALIMAARGGTSDAFALAAGVIGAGVAAVIVGFIGLLAGTAMLQLSPAGAAAAGPWRSFKRGLKTLSKEAESQPSDVFERYLAYAVAFGAGDPWFKAFKKRGNLKIPTWFDAMRASDGHASFAMLMATANSHTYTGGAGASSGGGAAGGGGSGAG